MYFPISTWFPAFALTLAVEAPIIALTFRGVAENALAAAIVFVFANLGTHLALWYVLTQLLTPGSITFAIAGEGWAVAAEALVYWAAIPRLSAARAASAAAIANAVSFFVGLAVGVVWPGGLWS